MIDLRGTAFGDVETGLAAARLFVASGTLALSAGARQDEGSRSRQPRATAASRCRSRCSPTTARQAPAELFAAALTGNKRASLVGERTLGRAARQRLVRLPDGSGLLLTHLFYLTPGEAVINEKGLMPDVAVEQPDVDFGQPAPDDRCDARQGGRAAEEQVADVAHASRAFPHVRLSSRASCLDSTLRRTRPRSKPLTRLRAPSPRPAA